MMKYSILFLVTTLLLSGCGEFQKIRQSNDANFKLKKAIEYFNKKEYAKTVDLLKDIKPLYRGRRNAKTIDYYYAHSLFNQKKYIDAGNIFNKIIRLYPNSAYSQEALFMKGLSYYKGAPTILLDQTYTKDAINALNVYIKRYPTDSKRCEKAKKHIDDLHNRLVEKSFLSARSYYDREFYDSAIIALQNSLKEYPQSKHREDIALMILESRYQLASNSILEKKRKRYNEAKEEYYYFNSEFPNSKYKRKVERIINNINKYLGTK